MKKLIIILVGIFSLILGSGVEYSGKTLDSSFIELERYVLGNFDFIQNGVKVEYSTNLSQGIEKNQIIAALNKNSFNISIASGIITAEKDGCDFSITIYEDGITRVEITALNNHSNFTTEELRQVINQFKSKNSNSDRYFSFVMVKLKESNSMSLDNIKSQLIQDSIESVKINNGEVLKGKLRDGELVNIGQIHYNTGDYLIIGTPVIFVTY